MSNRTIVEFNHDFAHEIERDPKGFMGTIKKMLCFGSNAPGLDTGLARYGIKTAPTCSHVDTRVVTISDDYGWSVEKEF